MTVSWMFHFFIENQKNKHMKRIFLFLLLQLLVLSSFAQVLSHGQVLKLPGWVTGKIRGSLTDFYVTGVYNGGAPFSNDTLKSTHPPYGIYLAKFDSSQQELWLKNFDYCMDGNNVAHEIVVDLNENIYFGAHFSGEAILDDTIYDSQKACQSSSDFFINKYSPEGELIWGIHGGGVSRDRIYGMKINSQNDLIVAGHIGLNGYINGELVNSSTAQGRDFVAKFNSDGELIWHRVYEGFGFSINHMGLDVDEAGNVYVAGRFRYSIDIDDIHIEKEDEAAGYILKFSPEGEALWYNSFFCDDLLFLSGIKAYPEQVYLIGDYKGNLHFDEYSYTTEDERNSFIVALSNTDGEVNWAKSIGGPYVCRMFDIKGDSLANLYVSGSTREKFIYDSVEHITPMGYYGILMYLDHKGEVVEIFKTDEEEDGYYSNVGSVELGDSNQLLITGEYKSTGMVGDVGFSFADEFALYKSNLIVDSTLLNSIDTLHVVYSIIPDCNSPSILVRLEEISNKPIISYKWHLEDTIIFSSNPYIDHYFFEEGFYQVDLFTKDIYGNNDTIDFEIEVVSKKHVSVQVMGAAITQGDSVLIHGVYRSATGTYCDTLTTYFDCDSIVCQNLIVFNHQLDFGPSPQLRMEVFPNPANEMLYVRIDEPIESGQLILFDMKGVMVLSRKVERISSMELDIQRLSPGIYFLQLMDGEKFSTVKVIKEQ
jgi:hypothetical protein